jgi:hypothetical protein
LARPANSGSKQCGFFVGYTVALVMRDLYNGPCCNRKGRLYVILV